MTPRRVLIVDDNPTNLRFAEFTLGRDGYEVRTAGDADEALGVLQAYLPHVILMDIALPGVDGLALTRQLRDDARFVGVRIVALTASAMKGDEARARAAGCDGYIAKPVAPDLLRRMVAEHAAGATLGEGA